MTNWIPNIGRRGGPRYLAIADVIAEDIERGRLRAGDQMPTHRELADRLGITPGTVTRAYAEAIRRGLINGETGRGTFVRRESFEDALSALSANENESMIDLSFNSSPLSYSSTLGDALSDTLVNISRKPDLTSLLNYKPSAITARHKKSGAQWVERSGFDVRPEQVLICSGALHAMTTVFMTLSKPGDTVLTEHLTYPAMKNIAHLLHLNLLGLRMDKHGILPDAFEKACASRAIRLLYTMPTIQNPTAVVMPEKRRSEIAGIAMAHDVTIVEDDIYGFLLPDPPRPLSSYAPDHGCYILSLSKILSGGLRIAYLYAPRHLTERLSMALRTNIWMVPPLMAEVASDWIDNGTADRVAEQNRKETAARQELARRILDGLSFSTHPLSFHLWLNLPEPWRADDFVAQAARRGVAVTPPSSFTVGGEQPPHAVRLCLGGPHSRAKLEEGLTIIVNLLKSCSQICQPII